MAKINKIKILAFAVFQAFLVSLIGVVAGILYSFGGLLYDIFTIGLNTGTALAFLALIGMPILFGLFGFIAGVVEAILYIIIVKLFSGLEIDFISS